LGAVGEKSAFKNNNNAKGSMVQVGQAEVRQHKKAHVFFLFESFARQSF
jgi:hypothetical protein